MAGFTTPNYTQAPNIFFDEMVSQMKEAELRVALVIMRETFGWHRQSKQMSLSYLMKATGMSKQGVMNGIAAGVSRGIFFQKPSGNSFEYGLVVNDVDQNARAGQRSRPLVVNEVDHFSAEMVNEVDTTKKEKKKEEINATLPAHLGQRRKRQKPAHMIAAEKFGLTPKEMTDFVNAILDVTHRRELADTDTELGERELSTAQTVAETLLQMGIHTPNDVQRIVQVFRSYHPDWDIMPSQLPQYATKEFKKAAPSYSEERRGVVNMTFRN